MDQRDEVIILKDVYKSFKLYKDKSHTLTEKILTRGRNKYNRIQVLQGVNLAVNKGDVIALIGENGCGKSTALKLISRIIYPDKGTVKVKGRISSLLELGAGFHPDLSGRENIYINASIFGLLKNEIDERINKIIDFSELWDFIDNPVRTYSSGMYMRLAFSVAINVDADILLIDEILAVGDKNFQKKCFARLFELKKNGKTIIIVTHDTSSVENICNRAVWINDGIIEKDGSPEDTINSYFEYMYEKELLMDKRQQEERIKAELAKKDFSTNDIYELYNKYLLRDPESEEVVENCLKTFDKKKDLEHYIKYSPERMAIVKTEKKRREAENLTHQDVIDVFNEYLDRDPEGEHAIENCRIAYNSKNDLIEAIKQSPEFEILQNNKMKSSDTGMGNDENNFAQINKIRFLDGNNENVDNLTSGKSYKIQISYSIHKPDARFVFSIEIYATNGYSCLKSTSENSRICVLPPNGTVQVNLPINLFPGKYKLFALISEPSDEKVVAEKYLMEFEVAGETDSLPHDWELV